MRLQVLAVGRPGPLLSEAIADYERRAARYWRLDVAHVRAERGGRGSGEEEIRAAESARLMERVLPGMEVVALTREGEAWGSERLAEHLAELALRGSAGATFLIGGALGLAANVVGSADVRLSLSAYTLPHDLARLVLAEQLYRAGTILRGEPYHKGGAGGRPRKKGES